MEMTIPYPQPNSPPPAPPVPAAEQQLQRVQSLLESSDAAASETAEEEALEDYMGRFMERLVGKKPETARPAETATVALGSTPAPAAVPKEAAPPPAPREPSKAPECVDQLALLREVANQSARHAIAEHDRGHVVRRIRYIWIASMGCSLFSSCLAAMSLLVGLRLSLELAAIASLAAWCLAGGFFLMYRQLPKRGPATSVTAG